MKLKGIFLFFCLFFLLANAVTAPTDPRMPQRNQRYTRGAPQYMARVAGGARVVDSDSDTTIGSNPGDVAPDTGSDTTETDPNTGIVSNPGDGGTNPDGDGDSTDPDGGGGDGPVACPDGLVRDCAGVCGGSAVEDCAGVCGGIAVFDCAGVCGGSAVEDCAGVCGGVAVFDCAGVCSGFSVLDSQGECCFPSDKDSCGICSGDNSTCCGPTGQCGNRGTCDAQYQTCRCDKHYTGCYCQIYVNPCDTKECNNGACQLDAAGEAQCVCSDGWEGPDCLTPVCNDRGLFDPATGQCVCKSPYTVESECSKCEQVPKHKRRICILVNDTVLPTVVPVVDDALFVEKFGYWKTQSARHPAWFPGTEYNGTLYDCGCTPEQGVAAARSFARSEVVSHIVQHKSTRILYDMCETDLELCQDRVNLNQTAAIFTLSVTGVVIAILAVFLAYAVGYIAKRWMAKIKVKA